MSIWVCTNCGSEGALPIANDFGAYTQFDSRYATGYCDTCSPVTDKPRRTPRPTNALVRADAFDRAKFVEKRERERLAGLVRVFAAGRDRVQMTDADTYQLVTLADKYGTPGFAIPASVREAADAYSKTTIVGRAVERRRKSRGA